MTDRRTRRLRVELAMPRPGSRARPRRGWPSSSTSMSASSARVLPASPWRARSRGAAGRSSCWRRKASPGTPRAATPALCCRAMRRRRRRACRRASASNTPGRCGALSEAGAEYVRRGRARRADAGRASQRRRLAACRQDRQRPRDADRSRAAGREVRRRCRIGSTEQVREALRSPLYFNGLHYPRGFSIHPLNYALGLAAAAERDGARIFENSAGGGDRSGGRAQARHDRTRACGRTMSCSPATSISPT